MARAVNDLLVEPISKGVRAVTFRPEPSASPKPSKCTILSPLTMPKGRARHAHQLHLLVHVGVDGGELLVIRLR